MMTRHLLMRALPLGMLFAVFALCQPAMALDEPHETASFVGPLEGCDACHSFHGASYPSLLGTTKTCSVKCHNAVGPGTEVQDHSSRTTDTGHGDWEVDCWACHDPHTQEQVLFWGSTYGDGKYIRRDLNARVKHIDPLQDLQAGPEEYYYDTDPAGTNPAGTARWVYSTSVAFTSNTGFVDSDGSSADDICRACHVDTGNFSQSDNTHTVGATANPGDNCTICHDHTAGWAATGGSCTGCHSLTQPNGTGDYRRQVAGTGGDFERAAHHVTDLNTTPTEIIDDADCEVCHDQTDHQSQAGSPAEITVLLNDPDGGASWTYDGTGGSLQTSGPTDGFCTGCHDSNGSTAFGAQPFTDGRTPPDIKADWEGSSHEAGLTAQACLSCHGGADSTRSGLSYNQNVHGSTTASDLINVRVPTNYNVGLSGLVADESPTNMEEEFCYACHDGAPATTDIETPFTNTPCAGAGCATTGYRYTVASGGLVNQRHDMTAADQGYSGGAGPDTVLECANCHDPHMATSSNKVINPFTPTSAYTLTYCNTCTNGSWGLDGNESYDNTGQGLPAYSFNYYLNTNDYNPMNPVGCTSTPATRGPAVKVVDNGNDTAVSGGTYTGPDDGTYTLTVTTAGASGVADFSCTSAITGDDCNGGQTYIWTNAAAIPIGGKGVTITITDGSGSPSSVGAATDPAPPNTGDDTAASGGTFTGGSDDTYTVVSSAGVPGGGYLVGAATCSGCDDTATSSGGSPTGPAGTYTIDVITGGKANKAVIDYTGTAGLGSGNVCGSPGNCDYGTAYLIENGVFITFTDTGAGDYVDTDAWTIDITSVSSPQITVTSSLGDGSGPTDITAFGTPFAVGTLGVTISFTDGGDGALTAGDNWAIVATAEVPGDGLTPTGDQWTIDVTAALAGCITTPEPDMISFCLVCHDGNTPAGVTMNTVNALEDIASAYTTDQHGRAAGNGGGRGELKAPWHNVGGSWSEAELGAPYAALQCTTCHDSHGSDNLYHLKTSITVRGQVMWVGGQTGSGFDGVTPETIGSPFNAVSDYAFGDTTYVLPCFNGSTQVKCSNVNGIQKEFAWGAFCTFCHDMDSHGQSEGNDSCSSGHKHTKGNF